MNKAAAVACCFTFVLIACASPPPPPSVPANLIPSGEREVDRVAARGVRSYECRAQQGDATSASWVYTGAEADLTDAQGKAVGRHTFPPSV